MANLRARMMGRLHEMYRSGKGVKKCHNDEEERKLIHSRVTLNTYLRQVELYADWLRAHGVKGRASDDEAASHIQDYLDDLVAQGKSEASVHTSLAALTKVFGLKMADFRKPRRDAAPKKGRSVPPSLVRRRDANLDAPEHQRLVAFARAVGIRREEYKALRGSDFVTLPDGYSYVIVRSGKGGKMQYQRIAPQDAALVKSYFDGIAADEKVFSEAEMTNKLNLHSLRREHAQAMYRYYLGRLESEPEYRQQLTSELRAAFERAGEDWRKNRDMRRLDRPYIVRGNVRRSFASKRHPIRLDRAALMAVNVLHLSHWRCDVGASSYLR